jgi:hypothetical protein
MRIKSKQIFVHLICFRVSREFKAGDEAPMAHNKVRAFPDWYKPYTYNYTSDGYMMLFFGVIGLFGYSYMNDIKEQKGRTYRKTFDSSLPTAASLLRNNKIAVERIAAGDSSWSKYQQKKERAAVHH